MLWLKRHKGGARLAILLLLAVALLGPWTYTSDGVPPPEWCRDPYILLENGRCVESFSAARVLLLMAGFFLASSAGQVMGVVAFRDWIRGALYLLSPFLLMLPFVSLLLPADWGETSRRSRVIRSSVWGLAVIVGLLAAKYVAQLRGELWGVWLYIGLAAGALVLELLVRPGREKRALSTSRGE